MCMQQITNIADVLCSVLSTCYSIFFIDVQATVEIVRQEIGLIWMRGKLFTSELVMFCSARTRIHLCADNRPWKENYNQSRGRREGTAHALKPNILIYKELIKYLKSKVASQSAHWWLDWGISVYLLPNYLSLTLFSISLLLFISLSTSFWFIYVFIASQSPLSSASPFFYFYFLVTLSASCLPLHFSPSLLLQPLSI